MGIELTPAAKTLVATRVYDPVMGARPLRRALQRDIEDHLAEKILFSELKAGEIAVVTWPTRGRSIRSPSPGMRAPPAPDTPPVEFGGIVEGFTEGPAEPPAGELGKSSSIAHHRASAPIGAEALAFDLAGIACPRFQATRKPTSPTSFGVLT